MSEKRIKPHKKGAGSSLMAPGLRKTILWSAFPVLAALTWFWWCLPQPLFDTFYSTVVLDSRGRFLGATIAQDQQWRFPLSGNVPPKVAAAVVHYEDKRFFRHPGVDFLAVCRAMRANLFSGRVVSGASTISMQVIRLARPPQPRSFTTKLAEMIMALRMELSYGKSEILSLYTAHAPYGGNVVGLEAASWRYFSRSPERLSWAEAAMLAVLPNNPALVHPGRNRHRLVQKRNRLLETLRRRNVIDALTCRLAKVEPLPPKPVPIPRHAPHLLARLASAAKRHRPDESGKAADGGFASQRIRTTLDRDVQLHAADTIRRHQKSLAANGIFNSAALIIDIENRRVLAYVGNVHDFEDHEHGRQVDVITAPRSTGSILKPILYAAMLESGDLLPHTLIADIPTRVAGFAPQNYDRSYLGAVSAADALARSLNVPAVRMLRMFGVDRFSHALKQLGMTTLVRPAEDYGLSLILGGAEGSLWDITAIYAGMAREVLKSRRPSLFPGNSFAAPRLVVKTGYETADGEAALTDSGPGDGVLGPAACWFTLEAMLAVKRPGLESAWKAFPSSRKIAWKTGTSYGHRDGWAVGVTPRYAVGVWVGNADGEGRPGLTGLSTAAPILFDLMDLFDKSGWFAQPLQGLARVDVCRYSGHRAGPNCSRTAPAWIPVQGQRTSPCPYCRLLHLDTTKRWQVNNTCEPVDRIVQAKRFVLPAAMEWYYRRNYLDYQTVPPYRNDCRDPHQGIPAGVLSLIYPSGGSRIHVPVELDGGTGRTVFEAAHRSTETTIHWHLDEDYLGSTRGMHQLALAPSAGEHLLTLIDENGARLQRRFTVTGRGPGHGTNRSAANDGY